MVGGTSVSGAKDFDLSACAKSCSVHFIPCSNRDPAARAKGGVAFLNPKGDCSPLLAGADGPSDSQLRNQFRRVNKEP
jgi:hypothetical protein